MEFSINKNSTLPKLKLELIRDGRNDFNKFYELIQNADITFTMTDVVTGVKHIANKPTSIELVLPANNCITDEYYLVYQFTQRDTSKSGRYIGQFTITFLDGSGNLIVPIRENLYINILDSDLKK
jgi:hypothetical protein